MYYLSACKRGLFRNYYCCTLFLLFEKSFRCYEKYCWFHLYLFLKKKSSLWANIRKKRTIILTSWKMAIFFLQKYYHFQYDHRFLFSGKTGNIRTYEEVRLKMKKHLESVFPSDFLQNVLIETSVFYFVLSWSLKIQNILKDIFSINFSNND